MGGTSTRRQSTRSSFTPKPTRPDTQTAHHRAGDRRPERRQQARVRRLTGLQASLLASSALGAHKRRGSHEGPARSTRPGHEHTPDPHTRAASAPSQRPPGVASGTAPSTERLREGAELARLPFIWAGRCWVLGAGRCRGDRCGARLGCPLSASPSPEPTARKHTPPTWHRHPASMRGHPSVHGRGSHHVLRSRSGLESNPTRKPPRTAWPGPS